MSDVYYKILVAGSSCNGGSLAWSLPRKNGRGWKPGAWASVAPPLVPCANGIHLTKEPTRWYRWGCEVFKAEYAGAVAIKRDSPDVLVVEKCRLLRPMPHPKWWRDAIRFVESLQGIRWLAQHRKPLPEWHVTTKPTLAAAWDAARAAARDAAWDAAWDAARAAAWDAAWAAARDAAWAAALAAAGDAAWAAARDAAWAAARDAALYVQVKQICADLPLDAKHMQHVEARMEVWRRGWALLADVNGKLFVYGIE